MFSPKEGLFLCQDSLVSKKPEVNMSNAGRDEEGGIRSWPSDTCKKSKKKKRKLVIWCAFG